LEELTRFDLAEANGTLYVVVESELLPPDNAVVVIPLLPDYPSVRHLNPLIEINGRPLVLATRLIVGVRRSALRRIGTAADQADRITRAIDVLLAGV
jgi:toxin CcdB